MQRNPILFTGTSHPELAARLLREVEVGSSEFLLGKVIIEQFPDHEIGVRICEDVQGRDVFVLQTIAQRPHSYLMELLLIVDALRRCSARSITAIAPYIGYSRQDRRDRIGVPIASKLVARMIEASGVDRLITVDLHTPQIEGFYEIPVEHLSLTETLASVVRSRLGCELVVVAPDVGAARLARQVARSVHCDRDSSIAVIDKRRISSARVEEGGLIGSVAGKTVLLVDDICSTGGTMKNASRICREAGASQVFALVTHVFSTTNVLDEESAIDGLFVGDTIPLSDKELSDSRVHVISVAPILALSMRRQMQFNS